MSNLERMLFLRVIDELWVDHLEQMEYLRDSVRLRAYGQRDPLIEYKIEGQRMFNQLQATISQQIANLIFKVSFVQKSAPTGVEEKRENWQVTPAGGAGEGSVSAQMQQEAARPARAAHGTKIGRNDPCPCGSGKKYKKCHGK
jgi:preprotein translocase subunit SecA